MILTMLLALQAAEPQTAIEAERAFARDAQELGQWTAFEKWAHPSGVIVGRNAVPVVAVATALRAEGEPTIPVHWWPSHSYVSCDGNLAVNSGPYVSPIDGTFGRFTTIWERGEDGWRYLVDMGVELDAAIAAGETPEIVTPNCDGEAAAPPPRIATEERLSDSGMSQDKSLLWSWTLAEDRSRQLSVMQWDGNEHVLVFTVEDGPR